MQRRLAFVVAALVTIGFIPASAQERRSVVLEIGMPNGAAPQLRILEGEMGTVSGSEIGKYGFVPKVKEATITIDVFDLNRRPDQRIAQIEATVGGERVQTGTKPQFGIRAIRVVVQ